MTVDEDMNFMTRQRSGKNRIGRMGARREPRESVALVDSIAAENDHSFIPAYYVQKQSRKPKQ